jgi:Calx-beta domain
LALTNPGGGALLGSPHTAVLTIVDGEVGGSIQFGADHYRVREGKGSGAITVTRSNGTAKVTVNYTTLAGSATAGADYTETSGTLTFGRHRRSKTFRVPVVNDTLAEAPEIVLLQLSSPTQGAVLGPRQSAVLTLVDNDAGGAFRFSAAAYSVKEGTPSATITVTRSGGAAGDVSVDVAVVGGTAVVGTDFTIPGALVPNALVRLPFAPGQTRGSFTIAIANDSDAEPNKTVLLGLQNPQGGSTLGSPATATLTIVDNDHAPRSSSPPGHTASTNAVPRQH